MFRAVSQVRATAETAQTCTPSWHTTCLLLGCPRWGARARHLRWFIAQAVTVQLHQAGGSSAWRHGEQVDRGLIGRMGRILALNTTYWFGDNPQDDDGWDLDRISQLVNQNDLERGRIEYKRQPDDGRKTLEAITALANTFGGVVLVGVDETRQGLDRLVGVPADERARLVSWCWSRLTPPFSPEIIPVSLGRDDLYVLVVVIDIDYIRRPVMINQGNKILVRLEGENQVPDWYRLRDLFHEQPPVMKTTISRRPT
jgi:hypothetical protein